MNFCDYQQSPVRNKLCQANNEKVLSDVSAAPKITRVFPFPQSSNYISSYNYSKNIINIVILLYLHLKCDRKINEFNQVYCIRLNILFNNL